MKCGFRVVCIGPLMCRLGVGRSGEATGRGYHSLRLAADHRQVRWLLVASEHRRTGVTEIKGICDVPNSLFSLSPLSSRVRVGASLCGTCSLLANLLAGWVGNRTHNGWAEGTHTCSTPGKWRRVAWFVSAATYPFTPAYVRLLSTGCVLSTHMII